MRQSWIYFVRESERPDGPVKIGRTDYPPDQRLIQLQAGSPYRLHIAGVCMAPFNMEQQLHRRFSTHRLHGEWFTPTPELDHLITLSAQPGAVEKYIAAAPIGTK